MSAEVKRVRVRYDAPKVPSADTEHLHLALSTDGVRSSAAVRGEVVHPGVVRDALLTVADVLSSDLRFKAQDRSDYLAYLLKQGKQASKELWNAQKAYLDAKYGEAELGEAPLDPVLSVTEAGVALEVFSRDESSYARLFIRAEALKDAQLVPGTTHLELSPEVVASLARIRSYRQTTLSIQPAEAGEERELRVPYRWVRAFSQVQAASTLPAQTFELAPVDLYNVLLTLRQNKAKTSPRALRYELVPGEAPRLVLEPWDIVLEGTAGVYQGDRPQVLRTWGRKRLMALSRLLPHAQRVTVRVMGAGLPAIYVVDLGDATLTLALSGWVDSGWAGIATFDLLAAGPVDDLIGRRLLERLDAGPATLAELAAALGRAPNEVRQTILVEMQRGRVVHDIPAGRYLRRDLFADPVELERVKFRDEREGEAHRLLETPEQVRLTKVHDLGADGVRIEGEVEDKKAHRTYQASFTLDREGRTVDATCSSPAFRRSGLREGPTVPMIALRLAYARAQAALEAARGTPEGRKLIRAETRTLVRRDRGGATIYRISLDDRQVTLRWGQRLDAMRMHRMFFGDADAARDEYFARLERLAVKGFIDSSAAEAV